MAMTAEKLAYHKAYREAHREETAAALKRSHQAHGKTKYYENLDLTRAVKRKSYYSRRGNVDKALLEQKRIDEMRLAQPAKSAGRRAVFSNEERLVRRKACVRKARYKHVIGIPSLEEPAACEVCGGGGKICMDHNHDTHQFRGWLCDDCNIALGRTKDNINVLKAMIQYLEKRQ